MWVLNLLLMPENLCVWSFSLQNVRVTVNFLSLASSWATYGIFGWFHNNERDENYYDVTILFIHLFSCRLPCEHDLPIWIRLLRDAELCCVWQRRIRLRPQKRCWINPIRLQPHRAGQERYGIRIPIANASPSRDRPDPAGPTGNTDQVKNTL